MGFDEIKGLVLCGGEGVRLRPLTYYFQKVMIPIGAEQKPLLEYIVRLLKRHKITDIHLLVGYKAEQIRNYFDGGDRFGVKITYVYDRSGFGGTGGALLNAYKRGAISCDGTFLIYYGDILSNVNLTEMLKQHFETDAVATLAMAKGYQIPVGVAEVKDGMVRGLVEKPVLDIFVGMGILALNGYALEDLERLHKQDREMDIMRDLLPHFMGSGKAVRAYVTDAFWYDVGSTERYEKLDNSAVKDLLGGLFASS